MCFVLLGKEPVHFLGSPECPAGCRAELLWCVVAAGNLLEALEAPFAFASIGQGGLSFVTDRSLHWTFEKELPDLSLRCGMLSFS